jgi:signal transduction histidine kinase
VGRLLGAPTARVVRYEEDGKATIVGGWTEDGDGLPVGSSVPLDGETVLARVRRSGRVERIEGYEGIGGELARGIHPVVLTNRGLEPAVAALASRSPVPVQIAAIPEERLPPPVEAAAYYIIAEAITNVAKYAAASHITVTVDQVGDCTRVEVTDDGVGGADPATGSGLRGIADRVEALNGHVQVMSPVGVGTTVRAEIPRTAQTAHAEAASVDRR